MADEPYFIQTLQLDGFRAYLQPKTFDFGKKRCLAIFAPNGNGKSSLIDALEFIFSKDGTLDRLGIRTINNQAGVGALVHNLADEARIAASVAICLAKGKVVECGSRPAVGGRRPIPPIAATVRGCFVVSPIIRGYTLRTFVEDHTPEQRYADVAGWLQLGPLVEVQKNLRALRAQLKATVEDKGALRHIDGLVKRETGNVLVAWNDHNVLAHANEVVLAPLDKGLALKSLDASDDAYAKLVSRVDAEERQVGLPALRQMRQSVANLWTCTVRESNGERILTGAIPDFEAAAAALEKAEKAEASERGKAATALFQAVWKAAEPLFADGVESPETCPICATPLGETIAGSAGGVRAHLAKHQTELADYVGAKEALDRAAVAMNRIQIRLTSVLPGVAGLLGEAQAVLKADLETYREGVEAWTLVGVPDSGALTTALGELLANLDKQIAEIEAKQGDHTYVKSKGKIDRLIELQADWAREQRTQAELEKLFDGLAAQAAIVTAEIRGKVQAMLDTLRAPMNEIYRQIQGPGAPSIRLELPAEDDTNQQRLNLLIDFAMNRTGVQPGGYLSDSQIHSVGLALRMAAIWQFNRRAPILALDDIVTSYDADHRRAIASLIATRFGGWQMIVTTHDERFFLYLKDQLEASDWQFTRIIGLDPEFGPRFSDHQVSDEMIEARWAAGQSAANEMRQAEEEWLLGMCRAFGVNVRIRPLERAYAYERSELAVALASFLRDAKLEPPAVAGVKNRFLTSLQQGVIENFGSHFQDGPYGDGSIGDERARWEEFKTFQRHFTCPKCRRSKFQRPFTLKKPICAHGLCEAQFEFLPAAAVLRGY
ncbi:AAA family ATPase [Cupriavidus sp. UME77]|uniref:AAA family ATPase n=1 Tax=Cupriavidus sp. UME77 TaxID=1862321 RepID=UPI0015FF9D02|nr:AAA family ATPase [Cupriavidus sp. UME77]MBB1634933.1 chromosome segregation protein SMC [Cupriavidus sp. UME77]